MFKLSTGTTMLHVPYKGSAPAITDTLGGQTQVMFPSLFTAMPYVKAGKLKALGVAGSKRSALMPDVPTLKEQGINDVDVSQWYAIFAPAKTPKAVVEQLNKVLNEVLADKSVIKRLEDHGAEVSTMTPTRCAPTSRRSRSSGRRSCRPRRSRRTDDEPKASPAC